MSDCCSCSCQSNRTTRKHTCPVNGVEYKQVPYKTVIHHLLMPWQWKNTTQNFYFCDDPNCDVVYFGDDDSTINKDRIRTSVGVKERSDASTICYCFGVSRADAARDHHIKEYVVEQTKEQMCDCETRNPSGKCCLKDFPGQ